MTPHLVQEALPSTPRIGQEQFVFLACQHGTEPLIKSRWIGENRDFRLAFSRPGLVTLKIGELSGTDVTVPQDWMIRQSGLAIGQLKGSQADQLVEDALGMAGRQWDSIHVFQRDLGLPGIRGFEPGPTELSTEVGRLFREKLGGQGDSPKVNVDAELGERVLDVLLVEPDNWLIGHHQVHANYQRWPGGGYSVSPPNEMVSRAYLKMAEALAWSGLPMQAGDSIVEIGSSPGGSCQRLLDLGLQVTGIDPAEMDPLLLENPRFEHWRGKSSGVKRKRYAKFRWLAADANVAPNYTLDCVEDIVTYKTSRIEGLLLTIKLSTYDLAEKMPEYIARVQSWGYQRVKVRQLAANRRECCLVGQRL